MMTSVDLNLLPLVRQAGQDQLEIPDLYVAELPRRPARGRGQDRLFLYLSLAGNAPLAPGKQTQLLGSLAKTYYESSGSVTAALRAVAETLNQILLDRNVRSSHAGQQSLGLFTQVCLRNEQLYLAQSGPVHAFLITGGQTQHLYEPQISGRGLGLSRATPLRFSQFTLQPKDLLLFASQPSPDWSQEMLSGFEGQGPEGMRRRLLSRAASDVNAVLVQVTAGSGAGLGAMHLILPPPESSAPVVQPVPTPVTAQREPAAQREPVVQVRPAAQVRPAEAESIKPFPAPVETSDLAGEVESTRVGQSPMPAPSSEDGDGQAPLGSTARSAAASPARPRPDWQPVRRGFASAARPLASGLQRLGHALKTLLSRMLPGEALFTLPSATMAFIAVAVPLVVVTVASMVYFQRGRAAQFNALYAQAEQMASQANEQTELQARRTAWQNTLYYLNLAESYLVTEDSRNLRLQAQYALDDLELIRRPDYQPAIIGGLPDTVHVTRMLISDNDLYLLDGNSGSVLRARLTGQGYQLDRSFQCGPDLPAGAGSGPLIDIAPWPSGNEPEASLVGMDAVGRVLFCGPDQDPQLETLAPPPAMQLDDLPGFSLDLGDFYVLDPNSNAVWIYWNSIFDEQPQFFFGEEVPPMRDVIDLAVNNNDLYLLHVDGHLTLCIYSDIGVAPTRCTDPALFIDFRPGRENTPLIQEKPFTQILFSTPPDPSLYLLEPESQGIFHFSLRNLAFQRQFLPLETVAGGPATAYFVHQIDRTIFLAAGNQVYYASMP